MFNIREYDEAPRNHDVLPKRFMSDPIPNGPTEGFTAFVNQQDFDDSLSELYRRRGCDADGRPTKQALQELELSSLGST
jgi:aldehyde:ferredoxin oxidoreductase